MVRRPLIAEHRDTWGLTPTVKTHDELIRELQLATREGDQIVNQYIGGGGGGSGGAGAPRAAILYDAIIDDLDPDVGANNIYSTIAAADADGHNSLFFRHSADTGTLTISGASSITRIVGDSSTQALVPCNIISQKAGALYDSLGFTNTYLSLEATQNRAFAVICQGTLVSPTALLNGAIANSTTSIPFDNGANGGLTSGYYRCEDEYFSSTGGGNPTSGTLTGVASGRGQQWTLESAHADNTLVTDIGIGHIMVKASNCELTACFWLGCNNQDVQCLYMTSAATASRVTACVFLNCTTFNLIAVQPAGGEPKGISLVGNKMLGCNGCKNFLFSQWQFTGGSFGNTILEFQANGNYINGVDVGGFRMYCARENISGNTFSSGRSSFSTFTNQCDINASGTAISATETSIPYDTAAGSNGARTSMGCMLTPSGEVFAFSRLATATSTGTSTAINAVGNSMDDGTAAWTTDQWKGQVVIRGTSYGVVASNTATRLTLDAAWRGGVPGNGAYTIQSTFVGCVRGFNGTTAAAINDNDVLTWYNQMAIVHHPGSSIIAAQANELSGNTFVGFKWLHWNQEYYKSGASSYTQGNTEPQIFATNEIMLCSLMHGGNSYTYDGNLITGVTTLDGRGYDIVLFGGSGPITVTNMGNGSMVFYPGAVTGMLSRFTIPTLRQILLGRVAGDLTGVGIPLLNGTAGNSVQYNIYDHSAAAANTFVLPALGASSKMAGVSAVGGIGVGSPDAIVDEGVITVNCDTGVVNLGDDIIHSAITAGLGHGVATGTAATGTKLGKAQSAKAAGANGPVTVHLQWG